jgi:carboxymethylenebutenolidase
VRIVLGSGAPAELVVPAMPSRGLVVAPDIMGLRPLYDDLCDRLAAEQGWAVAAPEPFPHHAGVAVEERLELARTLRDEAQVGDLVLAAEELRTRTGVARVAVLGFCIGGMYALKAAATGAFDRSVSFYGMIRLPESFRGPGQGEPLELLAAAAAPVPILALVGGRDAYTPPADVDALEATGATVVRYPEADHGFVHDPARPTHRPDDAADAWRRTLVFLA